MTRIRFKVGVAKRTPPVNYNPETLAQIRDMTARRVWVEAAKKHIKAMGAEAAE